MQFSFDNATGLKIRKSAITNAEKYLLIKKGGTSKLCWADPKIYLSGPNNYSVVGSPTITDGVVSNFIQHQNQLTITTNGEFTLNGADLEIKASCSAGGTSGITSLPLFNGGTSFFAWVRPSTRVISVRATSSEIITFDLPSDWNETDFFKYKLSCVNKVLSFYFATENGSYTFIDSYTIQGTTSNPTTLIIGTNANYWTDGTQFRCAIDLKETSIKLNNALWFYGKNYASAHIAPVPSGFTYGNTITPSIGYVDMRTQEFTAAPIGATIGHDA